MHFTLEASGVIMKPRAAENRKSKVLPLAVSRQRARGLGNLNRSPSRAGHEAEAAAKQGWHQLAVICQHSLNFTTSVLRVARRIMHL